MTPEDSGILGYNGPTSVSGACRPKKVPDGYRWMSMGKNPQGYHFGWKLQRVYSGDDGIPSFDELPPVEQGSSPASMPKRVRFVPPTHAAMSHQALQDKETG